MNDIITNGDTENLTRESKAKLLHYEILRNGADAAEAMCNLAFNLKKMRDERLYTELGFDSFEEYAEKAVGLKKSQAYDYIKALECLGEDVFRSSGKFGISKVKVLCAFTPTEAESFIAENDVDGMTVKELKAQVEELTKHGEQLSLDLEYAKTQGIDKDEEIRKLRDEIRVLENKPTEVAVREPSEDEIEKYKQQATEEYKKKLKDAEKLQREAEKKLRDSEKKHAEELKAAKEAAAKSAKEQAAGENAQLADEINRIKQHSAELEKKLKLSASPEITKFSFYFEAVQDDMKKLVDALGKIDDEETAAKLRANMCKYAEMLKGMFAE